jgi:hypothetical protein
MSIVKNSFFLIPVLLFLINQLLEKAFKIFIPLVHAYFDDLLALPVILGITLQLYRLMHPKKEAFSFTKIQIFIALIYVSVVFEWFLPKFSKTYTSDLMDVVCYSLGALYYYFLINPPIKFGQK